MGQWDLLIAHPPCTYLTIAANKLYVVEKYGDKAIKRLQDRENAIAFFMEFVNAECDRIAIENPVGDPNVTATTGTSLPAGYTSITIVVDGYVVTISGMSLSVE